MRWSRTLSLLGVHAEGEIGKIVMGGVLDVPGASMLEKLRWMNREGDSLRRFCVLEPRGGPNASVNLLLPPCDAAADAAFIVMQPDQCHAMSGSNAICVTTALLETGMVPMQEPETIVTLDTAAGLVRARAACRDGRCESVTLDMPASFCQALEVPVEVPGLGPVMVDIAFGGVFYALCDPATVGLRVAPAMARALVDTGMAILEAARGQMVPEHPERPGLEGLAYLMWCGEDEDGPRNATVMPPGRLDRSPCGTGSSARLAVMHRRRLAKEGASRPVPLDHRHTLRVRDRRRHPPGRRPPRHPPPHHRPRLDLLTRGDRPRPRGPLPTRPRPLRHLGAGDEGLGNAALSG